MNGYYAREIGLSGTQLLFTKTFEAGATARDSISIER